MRWKRRVDGSVVADDDCFIHLQLRDDDVEEVVLAVDVPSFLLFVATFT